jgi:predicted RNase H-like HicB family nuclease
LVEEMKTYRAIFEKDENGYWSVVAEVGKKQSAISDGQTLPKARKRIREALALLLDVPVTAFQIEEVIELPSKAKRSLASFVEAKKAAEESAEKLETARKQVASALVAAGLSRRDAGEILGVTGMRVQQMLG